ncbi:TonB family protein [Klebsiella sp. WOUb02]|uniref:TonB family protein n=1 Tax=Klebsiella sp. WOUb02 TaxID=3161071 RepID=UPI003CF6776A
MKSIRLLTFILPFLLVVCSGTQACDSTSSGSVSSATTAITTHDKNRKLRIQFDVDVDGRVQNTQILESTTTPEFERKVISLINEWRYEKGKPGKNLRIVVREFR